MSFRFMQPPYTLQRVMKRISSQKTFMKLHFKPASNLSELPFYHQKHLDAVSNSIAQNGLKVTFYSVSVLNTAFLRN